MARANLNINTKINEEFLRAQESRTVRIIKIKIQDEDLSIDGIIDKAQSAAEDFNSILVDSLVDNQACLALFCLTDSPVDALSWTLVAWVPDGCRVRDKMLYSSSREDLKRSIGLGYFKSEYAANQRSDLTWAQYEQSLSRVMDESVLTESERLVLEEKVSKLM
jgi:twinfilin